MDEEFDKEYGWYLQGLIDGEGGNYKDRIKSFYHSKIKKLMQAVGEEVIDIRKVQFLRNSKLAEDLAWFKGRSDLRKEQHAKLNKILETLEKEV